MIPVAAILLALVALGSSGPSRSPRVPAQCSSSDGGQDCSCSDVSYKNCLEPKPVNSVHVNNRAECILNCDLFHGFDQCDWVVYYTYGPDENCHMFVNLGETMETYFSTCTTIGAPTRHPGGACMTEEADSCAGPAAALVCPSGCESCKMSDTCNANYHQSECTIEATGVEQIDLENVSYGGCTSACLLNSVADIVTYFTWQTIEEICTCFDGGQRNCQLEVIKQGFTEADIIGCSDPGGPTPTPGPECTTDSECPIDGELCDSNTCRPGCRLHSDCEDDDYCSCGAANGGSTCPEPQPAGTCSEGCRDLGDACTTPSGVAGSCNDQHICTPEGTPKIRMIEVMTTTCDGCVTRAAEGTQLELALVGPSPTCKTEVLDNVAVVDYTAGSTSAFTDSLLGSCFLLDSFSATTVTVSWVGAGTWTPGHITVHWSSMAFTCPNDPNNPLSVSAGATITLPCQYQP